MMGVLAPRVQQDHAVLPEDQVPQDHTDQKVLWVLVFLDHRANLVPQDSKDHQGLRELDTISLIELIPQSQAHKARKVKLVQRVTLDHPVQWVLMVKKENRVQME